MASDSVSDHHAGEKNSRITVDNVLEALEALKETKGSSLTSLKKYFSSNLPALHIPSNEVSVQIKKALAKGIRDGKISKHGRSKFFLGPEDDDGSKKSRRRRVEEDDFRPHRRRCSRRRRSRKTRKGRRGSKCKKRRTRKKCVGGGRRRRRKSRGRCAKKRRRRSRCRR